MAERPRPGWIRATTAHPGRAVVLAASLPRLVVLAVGARHPEVFVDRDSVGYLVLADHPSGYWVRRSPGWVLGCLRPPGYPALLAPFRAVGHDLTVVAAVQVVVGVLVAWLTFVVGRALLGRRVGLVAGLVVALEPLSVSHSTKILTESPYTALLLVATLLVVRVHRSTDARLRHRWALLLGVALAAAAFMRPIGLYLPFVLLAALVLGGWTGDRRRGLAAAAVALLAFAVPVGAWIARNQAVTGAATFTTIQAYNLLDYRAGAGRGPRHRPPAGRRAPGAPCGTGRAAPPAAGPGPASEARQAIAVEVLRHHPAGAFDVTVRGAGRTLVGSGRADARAATVRLPGHQILEDVVVVLGVAAAFVLLVGGVFGLAGLLRRRSLAGLVIAVVVGYQLLVGSGAESRARLRVPLLPFLAIAAAWALLDRRDPLSRRRRP